MAQPTGEAGSGCSVLGVLQPVACEVSGVLQPVACGAFPWQARLASVQAMQALCEVRQGDGGRGRALM